MGTVTTTTATVTNQKHYRQVYEDDDEVCTQSQLKVIIMKQNIEIGELGYECVREYDGMFYSGKVTDINELGIHMCNLNYRKVREYSLETLKEWKDFKNLDKHNAYTHKEALFKNNDKYCNSLQ